MIPIALYSGFRGAISWIEKGLTGNWEDKGEGPDGEDDRDRHRNIGGWDHPQMEEHWVRWRKTPFDLHVIKNLLTEWVRDDAQRAGKYLSFVIGVQFILLVILLLILLLT